jgi:hypothetical protein
VGARKAEKEPIVGAIGDDDIAARYPLGHGAAKHRAAPRSQKELLLQTTKHGMRGRVSWAGFSELMVSVVWPVMI